MKKKKRGQGYKLGLDPEKVRALWSSLDNNIAAVARKLKCSTATVRYHLARMA